MINNGNNIPVGNYRVIPNYSNYLIYDTGRIYSLRRRKWMTLRESNHPTPYYTVRLIDDNGHGVTHQVGKWVLMAWKPTPNMMRMDAAHDDDDKANNNLGNLSWETHRDNCNHGARNCKISRNVSKYITVTDIITNNRQAFPSVQAMTKAMGFSQEIACRMKKYRNTGKLYKNRYRFS